MKPSHHFRTALLAGAAMLLAAFAPASANFLQVTNLITDNQMVNQAKTTDPSLINSWGISHGPSTGPATPFWVSDNGAGVATVYSINPTTNQTTKLGLTVSIPGDGSVTGQVFNTDFGTGAFNGDLFLFGSEDGTISGWRNGIGTTAETLQMGSTDNVYKGVTVATVGGHEYLYSANFRAGRIDVMKGDASAPTLTGAFSDANIPAGYAPFNVENINGNIFVTYAKQDAAKHDDVAGLGFGFVDEFDASGNFIRRIGTGGTLDSPWGMVIAPSTFGAFAGDLLVGNFGDGTINAFNLTSDSFAGLLPDAMGNPITIDGLWGLDTGNGGAGGDMNSVYFAAGPNGESDGLFGVISDVPEPGTLALLLGGLVAAFAFQRRRKLRLA